MSDYKLDPPYDHDWARAVDDAADMPFHRRVDFLSEKGVNTAAMTVDDMVRAIAEYLYEDYRYGTDDNDMAYDLKAGK